MCVTVYVLVYCKCVLICCAVYHFGFYAFCIVAPSLYILFSSVCVGFVFVHHTVWLRMCMGVSRGVIVLAWYMCCSVRVYLNASYVSQCISLFVVQQVVLCFAVR